MTEQQLEQLGPALTNFLDQFLPCCDYSQTHAHLGTYVRGLLSELPRKSVEPIALRAGTAVRTLQEFLKDHLWDHDDLRQRLRHNVRDFLACSPPDDELGTVGIIDESGTPKKGDKTPGVQRQWCGRLGKTDNCVVTVHLALARGCYKTLIDADLFLPKKWSDDRDRCREAGIPDELAHRTKWQIALEQVDRADSDGVSLDWLTFDEEYGKAPRFLAGLDQRGLLFVGEVPRILSCLAVNRQGRRPADDTPARTAEQVVKNSRAFREQSWTIVRLARQTQPDQIWRVKTAQVWLHGADGWSVRAYWLVWASNDETGEEKFFISNAPQDASVQTLMKVAFRRWNVEHGLRVAKSELGFGHFEGRNYVALMRHMSLCLLSMSFAAAQAEGMRGEKSRGDGGAGVRGAERGVPGVAGSQARHQRTGEGAGDRDTPRKTQRRGATGATAPRTDHPNPQEAPPSQRATTTTRNQQHCVAL